MYVLGIYPSIAPGSLPSISAFLGGTAPLENAGTVAVRARASAPHVSQNILVDWTTTNGSATAGTDYTATSGTLTITPGTTDSDTGTVAIVDRPGFQGDRTFNIVFSNARLADSTPLTIDSGALTTQITIVENDAPSGGVLATVSFTSTGKARFPLPLPAGLATSGVQVGALATQTDIKTRHGDGSIKLCMVSCVIPTVGTYDIVAGAASGTPFTPTWPTATVTLVVAGTTYTAALPAFSTADLELNGQVVREARYVITPTTGGGVAHPTVQILWDVQVWSDGAYWIDMVAQVVKNIAAGNLAAIDTFTYVVNGVTQVSQTTVAGAGTLSTTGTAVTFSQAQAINIQDAIRLTTGPQAGQVRRLNTTVTGTTGSLAEWGFSANQSAQSWDKPGLVIFNTTRVRKKVTGGGYTRAFLLPDWQPFYDVGILIPYLATTNADDTYHTQGSTSTTDPKYFGFANAGKYGNCTPYMPNVGGRPELGFLPEWAVRWIVHKTAVHFTRLIANADCASHWTPHLADATGLAMINPNDHVSPWFWLDHRGGGSGSVGPAFGNEATASRLKGVTWHLENAHLPQLCLVAYLTTGERYYLDEMRYWAHASILGLGSIDQVNLYRRYGHRCLYLSGQDRGLAWGLRAVIDAWWCLPDSATTEKAYLLQKIQNNLDWLHAHASNANSVVIEGQTIDTWEPGGSTKGGPLEWMWPYKNSESAPFPRGARTELTVPNLCFQMFTVKHAGDLGLSPTTTYLNRAARNVLGLFTNDPTYLRTYAGKKSVAIGPNWTQSQYGTVPQSWHTTWAETWTQTNTYADGTVIPAVHSPQIFYQFRGYYGVNVRFALLIAKQAGYAGATAAQAFLEAQSGMVADIASRGRFCPDL